MTTFYLDHENGNDALDGTTFANRWKTFQSGATAARIAPGDTIRVMASPDPTLVGNATWTNLSKNVTLAAAVTATISDCETAWTATANVTSTADTAQFKENTKSAKLVIASAFTTGKVAYVATGTLDLSAYQQVSFWIYNTVALAASTLSLRLCSDTTGDVTVHTVPIPAIASANGWVAFTVDLGTNLNSAIASVALYADLDPGALTVQLDNIIACKAASSANALSLTSLIGKAHNLSWAAGTTYAVGDVRRPTQPNRNGFIYRVTAQTGASGGSEPTWPQAFGLTVTDGGVTWTCDALEETWYAIQSISGTTVKLDNHVNCLGNTGQGYAGTTETVATYKRECIKLPMAASFLTTTASTQVQDSGTDAARITFSGGWDRTSMAAQTGETWLTGQNGWGSGYTSAMSFIAFINLNAVRFANGMYAVSGGLVSAVNCHSNNYSTTGINFNNANGVAGRNLVANNGIGSGLILPAGMATLTAVTVNNTKDGSAPAISTTASVAATLNYVNIKNTAPATTFGIVGALYTARIANLVHANNTGAIYANYGGVTLINPSFTEATPISAMQSYSGGYNYSHRHQQTADNHLITADGGTIVSATDERHTLTGISWKFRPTSTTRNSAYPLRLSVAKIACAANVAVSVQVWVRRSTTDIKGYLFVPGGQVPGVPNDVVGTLDQPAINTWAQSATLSFTPTETGVVEVFYCCYDGVGTTASLWIDDLTVTP